MGYAQMKILVKCFSESIGFFPVKHQYLLILFYTISSLSINAQENKLQAKNNNTIPVLLQPSRKVILSAEVSARLLKIHKEMGESFKEGDILLELDSTVFSAKKSKMEADLKTAETALNAVTRLYKSNSRSQLDLMKAENDKAVAAANLVVAEHELDACSLKAPYSGRVVKVFPDEYELLQCGQELISIVDDRILRARFLAPAKFFSSLKKGDKVLITIPGIPEQFSGNITNISAAIDAASNTLEVYAEVNNEESKLRGGMVGTLIIDKQENSDG